MNELFKTKEEIQEGFQKVSTDYANSPYTTNAGFVLRLFAKIIPVKVAIKLVSHLLTKK